MHNIPPEAPLNSTLVVTYFKDGGVNAVANNHLGFDAKSQLAAGPNIVVPSQGGWSPTHIQLHHKISDLSTTRTLEVEEKTHVGDHHRFGHGINGAQIGQDQCQSTPPVEKIGTKLSSNKVTEPTVTAIQKTIAEDLREQVFDVIPVTIQLTMQRSKMVFNCTKVVWKLLIKYQIKEDLSKLMTMSCPFQQNFSWWSMGLQLNKTL